ncbi:MAG: sugar kinase [Gammaproteobacteria bacterium]|nr:sugar kinase [Gammaproteobacteria bacterium]
MDVTWDVDALPSGGGKTRATGFREGGGGMAANASVAAARLGARAAFWGRAGHDTAGRAMREELASLGVGVDHFRLFEGARSSVSGIVVDRAGERMIVNFRGAALPVEAGWLPFDVVEHADAVLADPRWPEGAEALFAAARAKGVPTVLDGDMAEAAVFELLLPLTDCAVFAAPALAAFAGTADVEAGLRHAQSHGCAMAAVTLGERGVAWLDGGAMRQLPAFAVDVTDTTGAGDVFHGALAFALGAKLPLAEAFRFSSAAAALKCRQAGGRAGAPDLRATLSFLRDL